MKVLYLYSGERKSKFSGRINLDYPDTQFYGFNHLAEFGVAADFKEFSDLISSQWLARLFSFRLKHSLLYFLTPGYDIVFGSSLLFMMLFKKIFKPKRKFVLLNIGLARTLAANKKSWRAGLVNWLLREFDAIVCLSNFQRDNLCQRWMKLADRFYFIPLGVDINYYQPRFNSRQEYFLSVGRDNGRDYQTVMAVARLMPEREFQIVCSSRNLRGLKDIPGNVKIFYDLSVIELKNKYAEARALLLLTHDDNFSDGSDCSGQTVLLDALASGLPVIASKKGYLKDYVTEEEVLLVDFYKADEVAARIKALDDNALREKIARQARIKVEKFFSTRKMAENLAALFNGLKPNE